jgi:hypothetical protein
MLKVININSPIDLTHHDCAFVEQVIDMAEKAPDWNIRNSLGFLLDKIPVFLLAKEKMPEWYDEDKEDEDEDGIEYLGFYQRTYCEHFEFTPTIFICPERIFLATKRKIGYQELLALIIIHEFAHAIMDKNHENKKVDITSRFHKWVEEPFANWFVLKYFTSYGNGHLFHEGTQFIKRQPSNYRLGLDFYEGDLPPKLWKEWIRKKSIITSQKQANWLTYTTRINNNSGENIRQELMKLFHK